MSKQSETIQPETAITLTFEQLQKLLGGNAQGVPDDKLEQILAKTAQISADAMRKSLKPENTFHPGISVYSYPEGDRERKRPQLPFELLWLGFPVHREDSVCTWYEMEEYAKLQPGEYQCSLRDGGATIKVTVKGEEGPDGKLSRLVVNYPATRDNRSQIPSPFVWAYQMNQSGRSPQETFVEAMSKLLAIALQDRQEKAQRLGIAS